MKKISNKYIKKSIYTLSFLLVGFFIGCNSNSTAPSIGNFSLSVKKTSPSIGTAASDTLSIGTVKIMMRNVELFSGTFGGHEEHEDSTEVELGPFVINLNLNGSVNTIALTNVPAGTYNGVKFEIHRLNRNEAPLDSEFIDSTCGERGYSVIVKGIYFGTPFVYKSKKSFNQHVFFTNPVTVTTDGLINVTLTVDPYSWFIKNGNYIDPNNPENSWLINNLIRDSFRNCFRDDNRDGDPDSGH